MPAQESGEMQLQVHLAEFEAIRQENERLLGERQQILLGVLATIAVLVGIAIENEVLDGSISKHYFLAAPVPLTLLTWWYIRTYHEVLVLNLYMLVALGPKIRALSGENTFGWMAFTWKEELSERGNFIWIIQALSKFVLIQGTAAICIAIFLLTTNYASWELWEWILVIVDVGGFLISIALTLATRRILDKIRLHLQNSTTPLAASITPSVQQDTPKISDPGSKIKRG